MKLFIGGGGGKKDSYELDKKFAESLSDKPLLYIPVAMDPKVHSYSECEEWIDSIFSEFNIVVEMMTDLKPFDKNKYSGIYIGGGNTYALMNLILKSGFDKEIINCVNDIPLYGGSAGGVIMGNSIKTSKDENYINSNIDSGLKLLDFDIWPHFKEENLSLLRNHVIEKNPVLGIPENAGVIITNHSIQVIGDSVIFLSGRTIKNISKDSVVELNTLK